MRPLEIDTLMSDLRHQRMDVEEENDDKCGPIQLNEEK